MKTRRLPKIGTTETPAFVERTDGTGGFEMVKHPVYAHGPEGRQLRELRAKLSLSLREAAAALDMGIVEYGELERNITEPAPPATWDTATAALKKARGVR